MSAEAVVGTAITVASIGLLFLMLGWAQYMRQVHDAALIMLVIGAVLFVAGCIGTMIGQSRKR